MEKTEFEFLLQQGEGLKLEFKENFEAKSIAKEMVALANTEGGRIFIGVTDEGKVKGISISNKLKAEIMDVARNCDPQIYIDFDQYENVLIVNVEEGLNKPYRCSQGFFIRQSSISQKLTTDEIRDFFNKEGKILFDEAINKEFTFQNGFSKEKYELFLNRAKISRLIPDDDILKNLGVLTENGHFKNAGILLFCDNIERFFRQAIITCVMYKGETKYKIIDRKDFASDIITNYENAIGFLLRNLRLEYRIEDAGPRKEVLEIPEEALREAVVNAIAHRDYNEKGANIQIDIYDDRVEISNPGGLVPAIKPHEFGKKSVSRNPLLFSLLKSVELVERVGSGIERMRNAMKGAGLPEPEFEFTDFFTIKFKRPVWVSKEEKSTQKTVEKTVEKITQKITQKTTQKIIELIKENPFITRKELAEKLDISEEGVKYHLKILKEKNKIKRIGPDKGGHWEIIEK